MRANRKKIVFGFLVAAGLAGIFYFILILALRPASADSEPLEFKVFAGDGFSEIAERLKEKEIIRSAFAFRIFAFISGAALRLKPGDYLLSSASSTSEIISELVAGQRREVEVRIPDGASVYLIDKILSDAGVLPEGKFLEYVLSLPEIAEGKLFPDTYRFFQGSSPEEVFRKMNDNFRQRGLPEDDILILASLLEKEVPDSNERRIVAGILKKRLAAGIPLQVDATICYLKQRLSGRYVPCYPLSEADFKIDSPYNTYLVRGLPPGPIGSPGLDAIQAAMEPVDSPYWFYLSDPETNKTIFAKTFEEHATNRVKYLKL